MTLTRRKASIRIDSFTHMVVNAKINCIIDELASVYNLLN
jgi:hypothetical protein